MDEIEQLVVGGDKGAKTLTSLECFRLDFFSFPYWFSSLQVSLFLARAGDNENNGRPDIGHTCESDREIEEHHHVIYNTISTVSGNEEIKKLTPLGSHGPERDLFIATDKHEPARAEKDAPYQLCRRQTGFSNGVSMAFVIIPIDSTIIIRVGGVIVRVRGGPDPLKEAGQAPTDGKPDEEVSP
jgi:hypothetical protein